MCGIVARRAMASLVPVSGSVSDIFYESGWRGRVSPSPLQWGAGLLSTGRYNIFQLTGKSVVSEDFKVGFSA